MPSLLPGTPGAKEVYGITLIREDLSFGLIPAAVTRYRVQEAELLVMVTGVKGESGFGLMRYADAMENVFAAHVQKVTENNTPYWIKDKAYTLVKAEGNRVQISEAILEAYRLHIGDQLLVIKSTIITMGHVLRPVWERKLREHHFDAAIPNIDKLDIF